jgi:MFS family permease
MLRIDRHIAVWGGWVAGPAFGVALMGASAYFHLTETAAGLLFYGGLGVFFLTLVIVFILSALEQNQRKKKLWPLVTMAIGLIIFGGGAAAFFWPAKSSTASESSPLDRTILLSCAPSGLPDIVPVGGLFSIQLTDSDFDGGYMSNTQPAGAKVTWGDMQPHLWARMHTDQLRNCPSSKHRS